MIKVRKGIRNSGQNDVGLRSIKIRKEEGQSKHWKQSNKIEMKIDEKRPMPNKLLLTPSQNRKTKPNILLLIPNTKAKLIMANQPIGKYYH